MIMGPEGCLVVFLVGDIVVGTKHFLGCLLKQNLIFGGSKMVDSQPRQKKVSFQLALN